MKTNQTRFEPPSRRSAAAGRQVEDPPWRDAKKCARSWSFLLPWRLGGSNLFLITTMAGCGILANSADSGNGGAGGGSGIAWNDSITVVASISGIQLARNATTAAGRDSLNTLHVSFTDGININHALLGTTNAGWIVKPVPKVNGNSQITHAAFAMVNDNLMFTAWVEQSGDQRTVAISRSLNQGNTWQAPLIIGQGNYDDAVSLCAFTRANSQPGAVLAWFDTSRNRVVAAAWRGTLWVTSDWTLPVVLSASSSGVSRDVSVSAAGDTIIAAWDDTRTDSDGEIFLAKSINGGLNWNLDTRLLLPLGVSPKGQLPDVTLRTTTRVFLSYQNDGKVYLTDSTDGATSFDKPMLLGPGQLGHVAVNSQEALAVAWEQFNGDPPDSTIKSLGVTVSLDDAATLNGPNALPGSDKLFDIAQPSVTLTNTDIDVFWVDVSDPRTNILKHRNGRFP